MCVLATAFSHRGNVTFKAKANMGREEETGGAAARRLEIHARNCIGDTVCTVEPSCRLLSPVSQKHIYAKGNSVIKSLLLPLAFVRTRINDCRRNRRTFIRRTTPIASNLDFTSSYMFLRRLRTTRLSNLKFIVQKNLSHNIF